MSNNKGSKNATRRRARRPASRRRKNENKENSTSKENSAEDGTQMEAKHRTEPVVAKSTMARASLPTEDKYGAALKTFCANMMQVGVDALAKQFVATRAALPKDIPKSAFLANPKKNRYKDVLCSDETRVMLTWPADNPNDYIHANYVNVNGTKRYICTQGPTEITTEDFWRMVWQEDCKGILMLCEVMEQGKKKCEQYWPLNVGDSMTFGPVLVRAVNKLPVESNLKVTELMVEAEGQQRRCDHMIWEGWPDRGAPTDHFACMRCIQRVAHLVPVLVHCSAGIGRTGTIVGLEMLQCQLHKGGAPAMADIVAELRKYRHGSVQTDVQFLYMHRVMLAVAENRRLFSHAEVDAFIQKYDAFVKKRQ